MKKFCCFLMVLTLVISSNVCLAESSAFEEDFTIRNGIKFGMTLDELSSIEETESGNTEGESWEHESETMGFITQWGYHVDSLAGIPCTGKSTTLNYYFDDAGLLRGIRYWYGYYPKDEGKEHYDEIYGLMCEKYGKPAHDNDGEVFYVITPAFDGYLANSIATLDSYAEWIVEFNDTWVEIDVVLDDVGTGSSKPKEFSVGYRSISKEEMAELIASKTAEAAEEAAQKEKEQNSDI